MSSGIWPDMLFSLGTFSFFYFSGCSRYDLICIICINLCNTCKEVLSQSAYSSSPNDIKFMCKSVNQFTEGNFLPAM